MAPAPSRYDAVLLLSFGGPEGPDDVLPFLHNVLRGRDVPAARLEQVAAHYHRFGGISPINGQNRALLAALDAELAAHGPHLPLYWGNRNWHPLLADTVAQMRDDGVERALAFVTSAFGSYSGCGQYLEDIAAARAAVGPGAPVVDKLRLYFDHPGFVEAAADGLRAALAEAGVGGGGGGGPHLRGGPRGGIASRPLVLFSAHSIPQAMADTSNYEAQLLTASTLVAEAAGVPAARPGHKAVPGEQSGPGWQLVYQSRSGSPAQPWLGPEVVEVLRDLPQDTETVVLAPIGFVSDHMEVIYDLDVEAAAAAAARGIRFVRAATAGTHPAFVRMIRQLVGERLDPTAARQALAPNR